MFGYENKTYNCFNTEADVEEAIVLDGYIKFGYEGPSVSDIVSEFIKTNISTQKCEGWCGEIMKGCRCTNPNPSFIPCHNGYKIIPGYYYERYYGSGSENSGYYRKPETNRYTYPKFIPADKFIGRMNNYNYDSNKNGYILKDNLLLNTNTTKTNNTTNTTNTNKKNREICRHYKNGTCAFGDKCRNLHE